MESEIGISNYFCSDILAMKNTVFGVDRVYRNIFEFSDNIANFRKYKSSWE